MQLLRTIRRINLPALLLLITALTVNAGTNADWTGTYYSKKHLNGKANFQLGIRQAGDSLQIVFNAAYNDGHGPAPEAQGSAKKSKEWNAGVAAAKDTLEFVFQDSCKNSGSGTIKRAGNDIIVDFIFANAVDKGCLELYGRNMHLRRAGKR